jgi:DNA polymerase (family X)
MCGMRNRETAREIFELASQLEMQGANRYRVRAYRRAALGLLYFPTRGRRQSGPTVDIDLPWLDQSLRRKLSGLVNTNSEDRQEALVTRFPKSFQDLLTVPGIGPRTAARLVAELGIRTIAGLARAARAHKLRRVYWIGPERERRLGMAAESLLKQAA